MIELLGFALGLTVFLIGMIVGDVCLSKTKQNIATLVGFILSSLIGAIIMRGLTL